MSYWFPIKDNATAKRLDTMTEKTVIQDGLKIIRDALIVDASKTVNEYDDLRSIPDVWTEHRIFDMIVLGANDGVATEGGAIDVMTQYKKAVEKRWRAILTVMLIGERFYGLDIKPTDITEDYFKNIDNAKINPETLRFVRAVFEARPKNAIWNDLNVPYNPAIVCIYSLSNSDDKRPIALSSPTSLYVPAADTWEILYKRGVKWIEPKDVHTDDKGNTVCRYVISDDFVRELPYNEAVALKEALKALIGKNSPLTQKTITGKEDKSAEIKKLIESFIMDLEREWEENIFLDKVFYFIDQVKTKDIAPDNPQLGGIDPECYHVHPQPYEAGSYYNYYYFPMPLKDWFVEVMEKKLTPDKHKVEVTYSCKPKFEEDSTYVKLCSVSIEVKLVETSEGSDKPNTRVKIREYSGANLLELPQSEFNSVATWPPQNIVDWKTYYVFRHDGDGTKYQIAPKTENTAEYSVENGSILHRYYKMKKRPEFWTLSNNRGKIIGYIRSRQGEIGKPRKLTAFKAALDFGTSSTMLYYKEGTNKQKPLYGDAFWSTPICNPDRKNRGQIIPCFVPTNAGYEKGAPYQTALAKHADDSPERPDPGVLFGRWIYFSNIASAANNSVLMANKEIVHDLKWGLKHELESKLFLRETLYFIALIARRYGYMNAEIVASYPGAMTDAKRKSFVENLTNQAKEVKEDTGLSSMTVVSVTESLAVAKGLKRGEGKFKTGFCTVDIGGGTSDIFLCYRSRSKEGNWQGRGSSLKLGARDIFIKSFVKDRTLLNQILHEGATIPFVDKLCEDYLVANPSPTNDGAPDTLKVNDLTSEYVQEEEVFSLIEALLGYQINVDDEYKVASEVLKEVARASDKIALVNMRRRLSYYIAAVVYYAGMFSRMPSRDGSTVDVESLNIYFAGNGSRVIDWITEETEDMYAFVKIMFSAGMGTTMMPETVSVSDTPKHEVAYGALSDHKGLESLIDKDIIIAGERFRDSHEKEFNAIQKMPPLTNSGDYEVVGDELKNFLQHFNRAVEDIIPRVSGCAMYDFPENVGGFADALESQIDIVISEKTEMKPFFLMGVIACDPAND